jgi:acyl transferase domain-containing protein
VQFTQALATLLQLGVDTLICVGPGLVMRGLIRKNLGTRVKVFTTEDAADLARTNAATQSAP